jgi:hypothetical protein
MYPKLYFAECRSENCCHRSRVLEILNKTLDDITKTLAAIDQSY